MKRTNKKTILAVTLAMVFSIVSLIGCGPNTPTSDSQLAEGGVLCLRVNPEIAITYDDDGMVTKVEARNDDGGKILETYSAYVGKECRQVVSELVAAIGSAGYFVEEVEGESRQITIEIEAGSKLPNETFLDDIVLDVRECVNENQWKSPVGVEGESDYGITDYVDTDYGSENDGVTDYDDTDYGPNNDGVTDYNTKPSTGTTTGTAGATDYDDTDYGPNNDGVTDYDDTDYGPNNDGVTDYDDTDYGPNNDGVTDYDDTDYGPNNDGVTDYNKKPSTGTTKPSTGTTKPSTGTTDYDDGNSNYDDGNSNYDDGNSNYDDGGSNYDGGSSNYDSDSGYDD